MGRKGLLNKKIYVTREILTKLKSFKIKLKQFIFLEPILSQGLLNNFFIDFIIPNKTKYLYEQPF